jgi:enoyl-CoA hydratase/carnithine racemase
LLKEYKTIILEEQNSAGVLKLNRPKKLNAFNMQMLDDMLDAIDQVNKNDNIKSLIITGSGRAFCAGADLSLEKKHLIRALIQKQNMNLILEEMLEVYYL